MTQAMKTVSMHTASESVEFDYDERGNRRRVATLRNAGVEVWGAERVYIGPEVPLDSIEPGAVLMNAVIRGTQTAIGAQSKIGVSGAAALFNTRIGCGAEIGAGTYSGTTLFHGVRVRGFAELREGTVLEESAETAHNVGLKHTFFTIGVVAGSCINYCDVLVTGGSSRHDHTEIGSGAVHFNFDPHGDKFGSLIGDVTGLLLRKRRIFIGGNTGVVAPVHVGFGAVVAAGTVVRKDLEADCMYTGAAESHRPGSPGTFNPDVYYDLRRKLVTTAKLCGNLQALEVWYRTIRLPFASGLERILCDHAMGNIRLHVEQRGREVDRLIAKLVQLTKGSNDRRNPFRSQHLLIGQMRAQILALLTRPAPAVDPPADFLRRYAKAKKVTDHGTAIREMPAKVAADTENWLAAMASSPGADLHTLLV